MNTGYIHRECAEDRRKQWQKENKSTIIIPGDFVKIKFTDGTTNEIMWVEVRAVDPKTRAMKGTLANDPVKITNYSYGQEVEIEFSQIESLITP